jgi:Transglycosylase-like domain
VHEMKKKIGLTALCLTLALAVISADSVASADDNVDDVVTPTTEPAPAEEPAPPTTEAPAPEAPAPTTSVAPPTTAAPAPAAEPAARERSAANRSGRRGPDPRWIDYGNCGNGITACHVAKAHQRDGKFQWRHGRWFRWGTDRVRGHRGETWPNFKREARQLRIYTYALAVRRHREELVRRWSGVANCESGGNWAVNSGNGYYGGVQFNLGTWHSYGGHGYPHQQPAWYQAQIADRVRVQSGLGHWPHCGAYYG